MSVSGARGQPWRRSGRGCAVAVAARQRTGHGRRAGRGAEQRRRAGLALAVAGFSPPPGPHERNRALVAGVRDDEEIGRAHV